MTGSFVVEVGLCCGGKGAGRTVCRFVKKVPLCLQGWRGGFGTDRYRPLGNKFNKYSVEKDSWGFSSGRCTVDRRPLRGITISKVILWLKRISFL